MPEQKVGDEHEARVSDDGKTATGNEQDLPSSLRGEEPEQEAIFMFIPFVT